MTDPFPTYERFPFPAGTGPFRIKGQAYRGHVAYTEAHVPGGMHAAIEKLRDPTIRAFFDQTFLAATFYDVYPLIAMGWVCARLCGTTFPDFLRQRTRAQVDLDIGSVYRFVLRLASPETIATKIPTLMSQYFDFAPTTVVTSGPRVVEGNVRGVPAMVAPWLGPISETYVVRALEHNGAKNPRGKLYPWRADGTAHGIETGTMKCEWTWD